MGRTPRAQPVKATAHRGSSNIIIPNLKATVLATTVKTETNEEASD